MIYDIKHFIKDIELILNDDTIKSEISVLSQIDADKITQFIKRYRWYYIINIIYNWSVDKKKVKYISKSSFLFIQLKIKNDIKNLHVKQDTIKIQNVPFIFDKVLRSQWKKNEVGPTSSYPKNVMANTNFLASLKRRMSHLHKRDGGELNWWNKHFRCLYLIAL